MAFKGNDGKGSRKKIYVQLKSGNAYLRTRKSDGTDVFDVTNERHLDYWVSQPVDVYLVTRQTDETGGEQMTPLDERDALSSGAEGQEE